MQSLAAITEAAPLDPRPTALQSDGARAQRGQATAACELRTALDQLCITQDLLAFAAGVNPDTISRIAQGNPCSPSTRWRLRWAAGLLRQITDPLTAEVSVGQLIDLLGDTPERADRLLLRKAFFRHLRQASRSGLPPVSVWRAWRESCEVAA